MEEAIKTGLAMALLFLSGFGAGIWSEKEVQKEKELLDKE